VQAVEVVVFIILAEVYWSQAQGLMVAAQAHSQPMVVLVLQIQAAVAAVAAMLRSVGLVEKVL
jgi:hypothetical protein